MRERQLHEIFAHSQSGIFFHRDAPLLRPPALPRPPPPPNLCKVCFLPSNGHIVSICSAALHISILRIFEIVEKK